MEKGHWETILSFRSGPYGIERKERKTERKEELEEGRKEREKERKGVCVQPPAAGPTRSSFPWLRLWVVSLPGRLGSFVLCAWSYAAQQFRSTHQFALFGI